MTHLTIPPVRMVALLGLIIGGLALFVGIVSGVALWAGLAVTTLCHVIVLYGVRSSASTPPPATTPSPLSRNATFPCGRLCGAVLR